MKKCGLWLCCQSLLTLSIVIGLAKIIQYVDKLQGDFYVSELKYINILQWISIIIVLSIGVGLQIFKRD